MIQLWQEKNGVSGTNVFIVKIWWQWTLQMWTMSHCSLQMPYLSPIVHFDFDVHFQHVFPRAIWGGYKRWLWSNGPWHLMHSWLSNFPIGYGKHFQFSVKRNHVSITPFDKIWHCLVHPLYIHTFYAFKFPLYIIYEICK
jgi:hypothetical protein